MSLNDINIHVIEMRFADLLDILDLLEIFHKFIHILNNVYSALKIPVNYFAFIYCDQINVVDVDVR